MLAGGVASAATYYEGPGRIEIHDSPTHIEPAAPDRDGPRLCTPLWAHLYGMTPGLLFRIKFETRHTYDTVAGPFIVVIDSNGAARAPNVTLPEGAYKVKAQVGPDFEEKIYKNFVVSCAAGPPSPDPGGYPEPGTDPEPGPDPAPEPGPAPLPEALPKLSIAHSSSAEGSAGGVSEAVFTINLSPASQKTVTVDFRTAAGTAGLGDYTPVRATVTFLPGETRKTVGVPVTSDDLDEEDEIFFANLSGPVNAALEVAQGIGTILDDDDPVVGTPLPPMTAVADATVAQASPLGNKGTSSKIEADRSPLKRSLLKFQVSGLGDRRVTSVKLRLTCSNSSVRGGELRKVGTEWAESGLTGVTWSTQPAADLSAPPIGSLGPVTEGTTYLVTLPTSFIQGDGTYALVLTSGASDGVAYRSREKGEAVAPQLLITAE
jgi:hypothetical protein